MFDYIKVRAAANPNIAQHAAFGPLSVALHANDACWILLIDEAGAHLSRGEGVAEITLSATSNAWAELRKPKPQPGFQTLMTMRRTQNLIVTGDMVKFHQHLLLLEMLFSNLSPDDQPAPLPPTAPEIEPVMGRYLRLAINGRPHRLYFEEAGEGIPLICLHTAGSDGRQFRHILNDPAVTANYRVIVFDLPWHGKSSPPAGFEAEVYELTTDSYMDIVMAIVDALKLDRPAIMGCSIGGRAVLHLAIRHGDQFRAAVGLQSALYAKDRSIGDPAPPNVLHRPDIHGGKMAGASMAGMIAPQSPPEERWETMWHYMQGGPGIFAGDLVYYFEDGDLRNGLAEPLRNSACPIYLLSGDYDPSATPEMGQELADLINATHFEVMRGVGHFPMSENPAAFQEYLLPVLEKVRAQ